MPSSGSARAACRAWSSCRASSRRSRSTNDAARAAQRAARRRGQRPEGRPRDGRGEGALRARHDQARRDLRPALARAALNVADLARGGGAAVRAAPSSSGARRSPGSSSSPSRWRSRWSCFNIRVNPLGWPLAIASSLLYFLLFWNSRLYGDASLQIFFAAVAGWGWWQWLRGTDADGQRAARAPPRRGADAGRARSRSPSPGRRPASSSRRFTDTDVPWWDAFPTAASVVGQWLLGRKYVENWPAWIVVNVVGVGALRLQGAVADGRCSTRSSSPCRSSAGAPGSALAARAARRHERGFVVALLGAESTGKTTLAARARRRPRRAAARASPSSTKRCASSATARRARRARDEQAAIAARADARASTPPRRAHEIVVADTSALMIAVYSDLVFGDTSLYAERRAPRSAATT